MTDRHTRPVTVALIVMCLLYTPASGGGKRGTSPAGAVRPGAHTDGVLLRDSFDRADAPQPGAPWAEEGEVSAEFTNEAGYHVGPARTEVSRGALSFRYANHSQKPQTPFSSVNGRPVVYAPLARGVSARPAVFSFAFEPHPDNRIAHEAGLMSRSGGFREVVAHSGVTNYTPLDGFGISFGRSSSAFNNSQVSIIKYEGGARTILAERSLGFQFASGQSYTISLTVAPDFSATVHVSDGVSTDQVTSPAAAVSFPLDQFFIADIEGGISFDARGAGDYSLRFDDVLVREISPSPPPSQRPLIFIPGIGGSRLDEVGGENYWPGSGKALRLAGWLSKLSLEPDRREDIYASDVVRTEPAPVGEIYTPLLKALTGGEGEYLEYPVYGDPSRRTEAGCDLRQTDKTLFVFAYDWRKSSGENVAVLKDYVRCVQKLHPGAKVDLLAHSMGGLLARRYILDNRGTHGIGKLITIGSPWLGAPKGIDVMETGRFLELAGWGEMLATSFAIKELAEFYPGVHELLPSSDYMQPPSQTGHGKCPFGESGWDFNSDNQLSECYSFPQLFSLLNRRFPASLPATAGADFHNRIGQDDWRDDQSGVQYFHVVGKRPFDDTIGKVVPKKVARCFSRLCWEDEIFATEVTEGDKTVPLVSAERISAGLNQNAPGVTPCRFVSPSSPDLVEHTGLTKNPSVHAYVLSALRSVERPPCPGQAAAAAGVPPSAVNDGPGTTSRPAYYIDIRGAASVLVEDAFGNSNAPVDEVFVGRVPGITYQVSGDKAVFLIAPSDQTYTLTLQAGVEPIVVELVKGTSAETTQAIRYQDLALPTGVKAQLQLTPEGAGALRYDSDGDGTFETGVTPTAVVTGDAAQDREPPVITSGRASWGVGVSVSLAAADGGTGVKQIYYSTDGANFQTYSGPVVFDSPGNHAVYAFAEDNAANRSGLSIFKVSIPQRMPPKPWQ